MTDSNLPADYSANGGALHNLPRIIVGRSALGEFARSTQLTLLLPLVDEALTATQLEMTRLGILRPTGLCETATSALHVGLKKEGVNASILEGTVRLGERDWMEHRVNLLRFREFWLTIDLTASQFDQFDHLNGDLVALQVLPSKVHLRAALQEFAGWAS